MSDAPHKPAQPLVANVLWEEHQQAQLAPLFRAVSEANLTAPQLYARHSVLGQAFPDGVRLRVLNGEQSVRLDKALAEILGTPDMSDSAPVHTLAERNQREQLERRRIEAAERAVIASIPDEPKGGGEG